MKIRICVALGLMAGLSSCADNWDKTSWDWLNEGSEQEIIVKTDPPLADCTLIRDGVPIAHISPTPGSVLIRKTKYGITVTCTKDGYQTASSFNDSDVNGATLVHMALTGLAAWPIDSISGTDNKYQSPFVVTLPKQETPN